VAKKGDLWAPMLAAKGRFKLEKLMASQGGKGVL
jgi:hypothetical protein